MLNVSKFPLSSSMIAETFDTPEAFKFNKKHLLGVFSIFPFREMNVSKAASDKFDIGIIFQENIHHHFFCIRLVSTLGQMSSHF